MGEKKENLNNRFENKKDIEKGMEKIRQLKCSSYYFEYYTNTLIFIRLRGKIQDIMKTKHEFFYPIKFDPNLHKAINNVIERYSESLLIDMENTDYFMVKKSGENDIFFDFITNLTENLTLNKFFELENRFTLIYLFTELDNYLFKCFKYTLIKRPDILNNTKVSLKELKEANGNIKKIINFKAEIEAMSKFDLDLFIDEIIEKKIHNKFYKDFTEVFHYAEKILGIKFSIPKDAIKLLNFFKQVRNLYTHGDGTINQIFLKRINQVNKKEQKYKLGEKLQLTDQIIKDLIIIIRFIITQFDSIIIKTFPELVYK